MRAAYLNTHKTYKSQPVILNPGMLGPMLRVPMAVTVICLLAAHLVIWGPDSLDNIFMDLNLVVGVLVTYIAGTAVRECLHLLGYHMFGKAPRTALSISFQGFIAYARCAAPISVGAYRVTIVLPGLVLGIVPLLIGLATGSAWFTFFGALMSAGALGDVRVLARLRKFRTDTLLVLR